MYVDVRPFPAGLRASMSTWISIRNSIRSVICSHNTQQKASKLTDEGASGRNGVCVVDGGLETGAGALCRGSAGDAGFDISHALFKKETR